MNASEQIRSDPDHPFNPLSEPLQLPWDRPDPWPGSREPCQFHSHVTWGHTPRWLS